MSLLKSLFGNKTSQTSPPAKSVKAASSGSPKPKARKRQPKIVPADFPPLGEDFKVLDLPEKLNLAIRKLNFSACTPIQKEVLPHSLDGEDVIAQAQTGTGKTAAFLISIIT